MKGNPRWVMPKHIQRKADEASRLEWWTLAFFMSVIILVYLVMGNSAAMQTAWVEDVLSLIPPVAFLISMRYKDLPPNHKFPYGYRRVAGISFLVSALALLSFGGFMLVENVIKLIKTEHPTIGMMILFGFPVWQGWVMILVMAYSTVPAIILGHKKIPIAREINDKALFTDAAMNRADWMTAVAAIVGVLGVGMGWWWLDGAAAIIIAADVTYDGWKNLRRAVTGLMDSIPHKVEDSKMDPLVTRIYDLIRKKDWIDRFGFRLREEGHAYLGEVFIVPKKEAADWFPRKLELTEELTSMDWRIQDLAVAVVGELPDGVDMRAGSVAEIRGR